MKKLNLTAGPQVSRLDLGHRFETVSIWSAPACWTLYSLAAAGVKKNVYCCQNRKPRTLSVYSTFGLAFSRDFFPPWLPCDTLRPRAEFPWGGVPLITSCSVSTGEVNVCPALYQTFHSPVDDTRGGSGCCRNAYPWGLFLAAAWLCLPSWNHQDCAARVDTVLKGLTTVGGQRLRHVPRAQHELSLIFPLSTSIVMSLGRRRICVPLEGPWAEGAAGAGHSCPHSALCSLWFRSAAGFCLHGCYSTKLPMPPSFDRFLSVDS